MSKNKTIRYMKGKHFDIDYIFSKLPSEKPLGKIYTYTSLDNLTEVKCDKYEKYFTGESVDILNNYDIIHIGSYIYVRRNLTNGVFYSMFRSYNELIEGVKRCLV